MLDNYGEQVPDDLVLMPDISLLIDADIKLVVNVNWYDVILEDESVWLCISAKAIDYLEESDPNFEQPIIEIMRINDVLKRWSVEEGIYHA